MLVSGVEKGDSGLHVRILFFFRFFPHVLLHYYRIQVESSILYSRLLIIQPYIL